MLSKKPFEVPPYLLAYTKGMPQARMAIAGADHPLVLESIRLSVDAGLIEQVDFEKRKNEIISEI